GTAPEAEERESAQEPAVPRELTRALPPQWRDVARAAAPPSHHPAHRGTRPRRRTDRPASSRARDRSRQRGTSELQVVAREWGAAARTRASPTSPACSPP